jgi:hypothetical protein
MSALFSVFFSMAAGVILLYICLCRGRFMSMQTKLRVRWAYGLIVMAAMCKLLVIFPTVRAWLPWAEHAQDIALIVLLLATSSRWPGRPPAEVQRTDAAS